jgi:hypothetical protein
VILVSHFWDEVPEAKEFCEQIIKNSDRYKLFPSEKFHMFTQGIAATSGVDSQGDCFAPEALFSMVDQINNDVIWQRAEHNPLIQPIGRLLAARVFYAPKAQVYFVAVVGVNYDANRLPTFKDCGILTPEIDVEESVELNVDLNSCQVQVGFSPHEIDQLLISEMLSQRPVLVEENPDLQFRKAADPLAILDIAVKAWLLTSNPFSKKFLERFGEKAADGIISFFDWLRKCVITKLTKLNNEKVLFKIQMDYKECNVEFIVDSKDENTLGKAIEMLHLAALQAVKVIDQLQPFGIQTLVFEFEPSQEKWQLRHGAAKLIGVISDHPVHVEIERYTGFSVSGSSGREVHED